MTTNFGSNSELVYYLVRTGRIESSQVEQAFRNIDRREFVPGKEADRAYADNPLPLDGVTVSAPHVVAIVTELLDLSGEERVLEVGCGSGYQAAILGELADKVIGVEIREDLAEQSKNRVPGNVEIRIGSGFEVVDEEFNRVLFSCAVEDFDEAEKYVDDNGIIIGPVKEDGKQVLKKWDSGEVSEHGIVRYVEMED